MLKNFTFIALGFIFIALTNSCTKDPAAVIPGNTSTYTLDGSPSSCAAPTVAGIYSIGRPLDASNTVTLTVNVIAKGTYGITTTASNGVYFTGNGTFTTTGPQTIVLTGKGTPIRAGNYPYVPSISNTCNFTVSFLSGAPQAVFTYAGAPGNCTAPSPSGSYGIGVALGSNNYVDLAVTVTTPGAYTVSTNSANGISFSGSGSFTNTGQQSIRLIGNGTPAGSGTFEYTPSNNGCKFPISVTTGGGTSIYTLNCAAPVISGTYTAGVPLVAGNTVSIKADVTTAGTYSMSTGAVNGMTFSASGTFAVGTNQTIVLTGSGTPLAAGSNNFPVGSGGCSFSINTVAPPPAAYTLTCNGTTVSGSYVTGTPLTASNKVIVEVNVTTPGAYTITSTTQNGMTFSKTGVFTTATIQNVTLQGTGTPTGPAGPSNFTVGTAACPFTVTVTAPTSPCSGLVDGKFVMTGQFTLNGISFGASLGSQYQVSIQDGFVQIDVFFPGSNPPTPGTYSIGTVTMHCLYIAGTTAVDWNATSGSVYVSVDGNGDTVVEFCNVNFTGNVVFPAGTITSTGAGKMVF
jgi:hypothetical protein